MQCPVCGYDNDKVLETRSVNGGISIRRRRQCSKCGYRYTSYEKVEDKPITVIKKNGDYQAFDPAKISHAVRMCTDKRNISQQKIDDLVQKIGEQVKIISGIRHEITSSQIGEETLRQLYHLDLVAYVRFASVYRSFNNLGQFIQEIESLAHQADKDLMRDQIKESSADVKPFSGK